MLNIKLEQNFQATNKWEWRTNKWEWRTNKWEWRTKSWKTAQRRLGLRQGLGLVLRLVLSLRLEPRRV